jgi:uncharacterized membrane protein
VSSADGAASQSTPRPSQDKRVDEIIGMLLRTGVILAAAVVFTGGIFYLARNGSSPAHYAVFRGEPSDLNHVLGILRDAFARHPRGIIQFGILLLIATPVARVIFTVFAFLYERDWTYVAVTLIVLALLFYSLGAWRF